VREKEAKIKIRLIDNYGLPGEDYEGVKDEAQVRAAMTGEKAVRKQSGKEESTEGFFANKKVKITVCRCQETEDRRINGQTVSPWGVERKKGAYSQPSKTTRRGREDGTASTISLKRRSANVPTHESLLWRQVIEKTKTGINET